MTNTDIEAEKEAIINNLTPEQEDTLRTIHAEQYSGTDDDMTEDYEKWLENLHLMDLQEYLDLI